MKKYDAIIIGGGYGGLSSAAVLAKRGMKTLLIEKSNNIGGRSSYYEKDGFVFQYGQHSHRLSSEGIAAELFRKLGMEIEFAPYKGGSFLFYRNRLYKRPEGIFDFLTTDILPFRSRLAFLKFYIAILKADPDKYYNITFRKFAESFTSDREVLTFINFLGMTIMLPDISIVSAGEVIDFVKRVKKAKIKLGEPAGGAKQIISKLVSFIEARGGVIRTGETAANIRITPDGRVSGVKTSSGEYSADIIIYSAPLSGLLKIAQKKFFKPEFVNYCENLKSSSGVIIDFISREPLSDINGGILGVDLPLWVKFQTNVDTSVAPHGHHVTTWGMFVNSDGTPDNDAYLLSEKKIREIASICMPGYEKKVVDERVLRIPVINGAMLEPRQSKPFRPVVKAEGVNGLYFTGDTVRGEGCSGDIAFSSAMILDEIIGGS